MQSFFIFSPRGHCLFCKEYPTRVQLESRSGTNYIQMLFGLLQSMQKFANLINPSPAKTPYCTVHCYNTKDYKIHCYEALTGVRFVACTEPQTSDLRVQLIRLYSTLYVDYVMKNPFYTPGEIIKCELFEKKLDEFFAPLLKS
ncbi:MAG: putative trafficking protein particle complex 1 [Streblomastix strix]|uniref:Trafficking protein particle complex subunit n=1 Tax=Streblomastix strix TaxID=222440 RepID=A0A5J4UT82_9EUKA|nr:MAG: putative trafficking protein particle complex 1 [Streblomastix strix]